MAFYLGCIAKCICMPTLQKSMAGLHREVVRICSLVEANASDVVRLLSGPFPTTLKILLFALES